MWKPTTTEAQILSFMLVKVKASGATDTEQMIELLQKQFIPDSPIILINSSEEKYAHRGEAVR